MLIGVPKEIKTHEYRVGMTPSSVREAISRGHSVLVESDSAEKIGITDQDYIAAGAIIAGSAEEVWGKSEMIVKVKEPQKSEYSFINSNMILFTYLHLAPDPDQAEALINSGCSAIAYETVTDHKGGLPLLAPMSMVAGRMSIQCGAHFLEISKGGRGQLLGGVPGVPAAKVVIFGGGIVGTNAAKMAVGLGADVYIFDLNPSRLSELDQIFGTSITTLYPTIDVIEEKVTDADLIIGAVLVPGASAPCVVTEELVKKMNKGSVMVDVSIDQGGCFETSRGTTHADPSYVVHDVIHYCVTNMPGAVARTSTYALNNSTLPFILNIADKGLKISLIDDANLANGLNVHSGKVTNKPVSESLGLPYKSIEAALN